MKLRGKTQKGKNRIRELGVFWKIERIQDSVLFDPRPGPWALAFPVAKGKEHSRWLHLTDDRDFEVWGQD